MNGWCKMKKKKEVIIVISAILFVIALLVKVNLTLQLILMLIAYILVGKDTVLGAIKNVEKREFLMKEVQEFHFLFMTQETY